MHGVGSAARPKGYASSILVLSAANCPALDAGCALTITSGEN
jgi:hypothetical protein